MLALAEQNQLQNQLQRQRQRESEIQKQDEGGRTRRTTLTGARSKARRPGRPEFTIHVRTPMNKKPLAPPHETRFRPVHLAHSVHLLRRAHEAALRWSPSARNASVPWSVQGTRVIMPNQVLWHFHLRSGRQCLLRDQQTHARSLQRARGFDPDSREREINDFEKRSIKNMRTCSKPASMPSCI